MFLRAAEWVGSVLIVSVFATQVFLPLVRGTPFFPFFRRERSLEGALKDARQEAAEKRVESEIEKIKKDR